ncbi:hypothetical protein RJ45_06470 [Photobacterium gaetbulicola]|uniref:LexA repressor DNA-binding domain-containing protein n=1 Tax=Photobacterium gaetbulicola TaxID=1295392 RepID=A0A0B9H6A2_9GAMM|nr:MarR family transcriptional regulator [Photobacterium gaetbulicola]KHT64432.1 hypothetical protein RJ45_06470 [Photobacterium gaetbulicola]
MKAYKDQRYTRKQGQYLAFIYYYMKINKMAPSESDMAKYFEVASSTVHGMVRELKAKKLIKSEAGKARSIQLMISRDELPDLE